MLTFVNHFEPVLLNGYICSKDVINGSPSQTRIGSETHRKKMYSYLNNELDINGA